MKILLRTTKEKPAEVELWHNLKRLAVIPLSDFYRDKEIHAGLKIHGYIKTQLIPTGD